MNSVRRSGRIMSKRLSLYGLIALTSLCIFFVAFNQLNNGYPEHRLQRFLMDEHPRSENIKIQELVTDSAKIVDLQALSYVSDLEIDGILEQQRQSIEREMDGYAYRNVNSLNELLMERGGRPVRSVILTTWRSGSTFLGDAINAHPASFYHYEPLLHFGIVQVREPPLAIEALEHIVALFHCNYRNLEKYLDYGKDSHPWVFNHNTHLWRRCQAHKEICWDPDFASKFCRLFPFQSMKLVRLRLGVAKRILEKESLGVRMVLLVRDPRGVLQSRRHREWCPGNPDCADPALVCSDMVSDFTTAVYLANKYPRNFRVIRYEDLSVDPFTHVKDLYDFYGLDFHENAQDYLDTHTKSDLGGVSSTYRNSKAAPFHWRTDLDFEEVEEIQNVCSRAMKLWGYVPATNATHQESFDPITDYTLNL